VVAVAVAVAVAVVKIKSEPLLTGIGPLCEVGILIQTCYYEIH
jgi:DNA-binding MltR family transcriptional regulator